MNVRELLAKRAALIGQARALVDKAQGESRAFGAEEETQYNALITQVDGLQTDIDRLTRLEGLEAGLGQRQTSADPSIGMSDQETQRYSFLRALDAAASHDWSQAGLELEASQAVAKRLGRKPRSFFVPSDVLARRGAVSERVRVPRVGWQYRDLTKAGDGGNLIATDLLVGSFIDMLRNRMVVQQAGARVLSELVGDIDIPRQTGGATAYWVGEGGAPTKSDQALDQVALAPKTVAGYTEISRKMLKQSSRDAEQFVRDDLNQALALAADLAALHGSGSANQPLGVANTPGIGLVVGGDDGAAPQWPHIVGLETEIATDNADVGNLAYITNALVRGKLKVTNKAGFEAFIWEGNEDPVNGYSAFTTNQVRSNLDKGGAIGVCSAIFFGNWADLIVALWGELDVLVNPFSLDTTGAVRVTAFMDTDIAVRHPQSFSAMLDALTA